MDNLDEHAINVFTDGSSYSGPRAGGVGIRIVTIGDDGHEIVFDHQPLGVRGGNNQQMELLACIEALKLLAGRHSPIDLTGFHKVVISTDSTYVVEGYDSARFTWPRSRWLTRDGTPVANAKLWKELVKRSTAVGMRVEIKWVKGHKSSAHNKAADKLAKGSAKLASRPPLSVVSVRRKMTKKSVERGSVALTGQRLTIRIITDEYLSVQRCYRYKYEVMSKSSNYYENVDIAYSELLLRAGHTYYVRMNDNTRNPRILKQFREVAP